MFHQVSFADWSGPVAVAAFVVSAGVFLFFLVGALRMPQSKVQHDAELPFQKENQS